MPPNLFDWILIMLKSKIISFKFFKIQQIKCGFGAFFFLSDLFII